MEPSFGDLVRAARIKQGWTQAEVARRLDTHGIYLTQPMVSSVERGMLTPDVWAVTALCLTLRIRPQVALAALGWHN